MKLTTRLEDMRGAISACIKCNGCTYGPWPENYIFCPLYARDEAFTFSGGGLVYLSKAILKGHMDYSQSLADLAFTCSACGACDGKCVIVRSINPEMALSDIIRLLRYELVKRGFVPEGPIKEMYEDVKKNGDLLGKGQGETIRIPDRIRNDKADVLLIAECIHSDAQIEPFHAALHLLEKMKKPVAIFADQGCCGSTLYDFGFWDQLPSLVEAKWRKMQSFGKKKVLFLDPHCQEFMTNKYSKIIDSFNGFRGQHFSELLLDAFNKGKLKSKKMKKVKVSYHDPCFLGRGLGIYDPPRQVLQHLDGVQLVEMERNREQSFCCGARGMGNYFEDFAKGTAKERIKEFFDTKADMLITACPYCKKTFQTVLGRDQGRVMDLIAFVDKWTK
jgi:heterodisulfide reductase subunit D